MSEEKKSPELRIAELKAQTLTERIAQITAQYENDLADIRAQATLMSESFNDQFNNVLEDNAKKTKEIEELNAALVEYKQEVEADLENGKD